MSIIDTIKQNGLLKGIALDVYEIISESPTSTVGEIFRKYKAKRPRFARSRNEIAKRVRDLEVWGAIRKDGAAKCEFSGRNVSTFIVTGKLPDRTVFKPLNPYSFDEPTQEASLSPLDVTALLENKNEELAKAREAMTKLYEQVDNLLVAVEGGYNHFEALKHLQKEKSKKIRSFFTTKATKAKLKKELDAIEYILSTFRYISTARSVA